MAFKPNYRFDRSERTRSKAAKKQEKQQAQAARREAGRDKDVVSEEAYSPNPIEPHED